MQDIRGLALIQLKETLQDWDEPGFHAQQIFSWIYKKSVADFDAMSDLPEGLRRRLKENFCICESKLVKTLKSKDGTEKFLFELRDGDLIEAVNIPAEKRITGCISTQVGCKFSCFFCASGLLGYKRNLTCAEMVDEVLQLKNRSLDNRLTHIVFMGTGEPLDNYDFVLKAIRIINSPEGLNIGARRITISTCGIIPGIKKLAAEGLQIELSISLHASDDKTRSSLMPTNKKYPLKELIEASADYIRRTGRQITFEYILIKEMNSDLQSAKNLVKILRGLNCKVNIIPANPIKECRIEPPGKLDILLFRDTLLKSGVRATLRKPRGGDIEAACGQLRSRYEEK